MNNKYYNTKEEIKDEDLKKKSHAYNNLYIL